MDRGVIDQPLFEESRSFMKKNKTRHGRALLEMGVLTPELCGARSWPISGPWFSRFSPCAPASRHRPTSRRQDENIVLDASAPEIVLEGVHAIEDQDSSRAASLNALFSPASSLNLPRLAEAFEHHVLSLVAPATPAAAVIQKANCCDSTSQDPLLLAYSLDLRPQTASAPTHP